MGRNVHTPISISLGRFNIYLEVSIAPRHAIRRACSLSLHCRIIKVEYRSDKPFISSFLLLYVLNFCCTSCLCMFLSWCFSVSTWHAVFKLKTTSQRNIHLGVILTVIIITAMHRFLSSDILSGVRVSKQRLSKSVKTVRIMLKKLMLQVQTGG